jgi:hypothetical protein
LICLLARFSSPDRHYVSASSSCVAASFASASFDCFEQTAELFGRLQPTVS